MRQAKGNSHSNTTITMLHCSDGVLRIISRDGFPQNLVICVKDFGGKMLIVSTKRWRTLEKAREIDSSDLRSFSQVNYSVASKPRFMW